MKVSCNDLAQRLRHQANSMVTQPASPASVIALLQEAAAVLETSQRIEFADFVGFMRHKDLGHMLAESPRLPREARKFENSYTQTLWECWQQAAKGRRRADIDVAASHFRAADGGRGQ